MTRTLAFQGARSDALEISSQNAAIQAREAVDLARNMEKLVIEIQHRCQSAEELARKALMERDSLHDALERETRSRQAEKESLLAALELETRHRQENHELTLRMRGQQDALLHSLQNDCHQCKEETQNHALRLQAQEDGLQKDAHSRLEDRQLVLRIQAHQESLTESLQRETQHREEHTERTAHLQAQHETLQAAFESESEKRHDDHQIALRVQTQQAALQGHVHQLCLHQAMQLESTQLSTRIQSCQDTLHETLQRESQRRQEDNQHVLSRVNGHQQVVQEELAQIRKAVADLRQLDDENRMRAQASDAEFRRLLDQESHRTKSLEEEFRFKQEQEARRAQMMEARQVDLGKQVSAVQEESRQRGAALHAVEQDTISMRQSAEQVRRTAEVVEQTMNVRLKEMEGKIAHCQQNALQFIPMAQRLRFLADKADEVEAMIESRKEEPIPKEVFHSPLKPTSGGSFFRKIGA